MSDYNGWTNRETWCVNLWLNNDEPTYRFIERKLPFNGEALENLIEPIIIGGIYYAIETDIHGKWDKVNWDEIAEAWNE